MKLIKENKAYASLLFSSIFSMLIGLLIESIDATFLKNLIKARIIRKITTT